MSDNTVALEVTMCQKTENGTLEFSPRRIRAALSAVFGIPLAPLGILAMLSNSDGDGAIFLGGGLVSLGVRGLKAPTITINVDQRTIQSQGRGSQSLKTWSFNEVTSIEGIPEDDKKASMALNHVKLKFKDGTSLDLFSTADIKKSSKIGGWLNDVFGTESEAIAV